MKSLYVHLPFTCIDAWAAYPYTGGRTFVDTMRDPGAFHLWIGRFYGVFGWARKVPSTEAAKGA